jgi:hypothetical protein
MTCKLTMTLISEHQEGECGNDWKYDIEAQVFHEGLQGEGGFRVPKHLLEPGHVHEPHGAPAPVELFSGECLTELLVKIHLTATEVDMFVNDVGHEKMELRIECPGPGGEKVTKEVDVAANVKEAPAILNKRSVFTVRVRFTLVCDAV